MTGKSPNLLVPQSTTDTHAAVPETGPAATDAPAGSVRSTMIEAATAQAAMQPWIEMECYQLGRGKRLAQLDSVDLGSRQIVRERQEVAVQKLGVTPANLCTVSCCTPDPTFRFSELRAGDDETLFFMPGNYEFDLYVPAGAQTAYISFDQDEFITGARVLDPARWESGPSQLLSIPTAQQSSFNRLVDRFFEASDTLRAGGESADIASMQGVLLQNILLMAVSPGASASEPPSMERARAFHVCKAARAFVDESLAADLVPTIVDICITVGVSERTLQYAFRAYVHMSPLAYLRMCRLNRVRETLLASDPQATTVTAVAMCFGFLHLGRFSLEYKRAFDEAPSTTLAL
jgi:AraC family ethanolamine operon transcriptional activator